MTRSREISSESARSNAKGSRSASGSSSPGRRSPHEKRSDYRSPRRRSPSPSRYRGKFENPEPCKCLGVFGLSLRTDERELKDIFRKCGSIDNVTVVYDRRSGRSRGFGFIKFKHQSDADEARKNMNGIDIDGRRIRVDYSVTKRPHSPTPGVYMGKVDDRYRDRRSPYDGGRDYDRRSSYRRRSPSRSRSYERRR